MNESELIILVGAQFVPLRVKDSEIEQTQADLLTVINTSACFLRDRLCARGDSITGWYFRPVYVPPPDPRVDAINRMTDVIEKSTKDGDDWKG